MDTFIMICPQCGDTYCNGQKCPFCKTDMINTGTTSTEHAHMIFDKHHNNGTTLLVWETKQLEKIKQSGQFSQALYDARIRWEKEQEEIGEAIAEEELAEFERQYQPRPPKPVLHCPTCGGVRVNRVPLGKKIAGVFAFGFFSKNGRSQFECKDCGYKW